MNSVLGPLVPGMRKPRLAGLVKPLTVYASLFAHLSTGQDNNFLQESSKDY